MPMTLKYLILGGSALLLGFLFFRVERLSRLTIRILSRLFAPLMMNHFTTQVFCGQIRLSQRMIWGSCIGLIKQKSALRTPMRAALGSLISLFILNALGSGLNAPSPIQAAPANIHIPYRHFPFLLKRAGCKLSSTIGSAISQNYEKMRFASPPLSIS